MSSTNHRSNSVPTVVKRKRNEVPKASGGRRNSLGKNRAWSTPSELTFSSTSQRLKSVLKNSTFNVSPDSTKRCCVQYEQKTPDCACPGGRLTRSLAMFAAMLSNTARGVLGGFWQAVESTAPVTSGHLALLIVGVGQGSSKGNGRFSNDRQRALGT